MNDFSSRGNTPSLWERSWFVIENHFITCATCALAVSNKFLVLLLGKVRFGVWIDLVKEKFATLCKNFFVCEYFSYFCFSL